MCIYIEGKTKYMKREKKLLLIVYRNLGNAEDFNEF